jgi:hypothetical protein
MYKITDDRYFNLYKNKWARYELLALQKNLMKLGQSIFKPREYQLQLGKRIIEGEALIND